MRLTCPNCGAQYEVPDGVIPDEGRDVQCSNCGTTWFQHHPDHPLPEPTPEPGPEPAPEPEPAPVPQRRLDPAVADILRAEADRERAARAAEADGRIETQPDLGLTEPGPDKAQRVRAARDRMERLRNAPQATAGAKPPRKSVDADDAQEGIHPESRRDLLPDVEKITSSLRASDVSTGAPASVMPEHMVPAPRRGGFRTGFRLAVVICVVAFVVYVMAPRIAALWPAAEAPLSHYLQTVDGVREMLSATVADLRARF